MREVNELSATPAGQWVPPLLINVSGHGFMRLKGHDLGNDCEAGLPREFYLPESGLNFSGQNVLVLGLWQTVNRATVNAAELIPVKCS